MTTGAATTAAFDLAALLSPVRVEDFFADSWQREPLHHRRGDERYYDPLLRPEQLDEIVGSPQLRHPAIQLARDGGYLPADAYTKNVRHGGEVFQGVLDPDRVRSEYRAGASIVLPALHGTWRPLRDLCDSLESQLSHPVHANAYLTPGNAMGFTPHYDTHDVFVLQIAGNKRWRVYDPPLALPHHSQPFSPSSYTLPVAPRLELELRAGDLLYLPRGYVHTAFTSDRPSAHVSIGVTLLTWVDLIGEVLRSAKNAPALREALPVGFARPGDVHGLREDLVRRLDELRERTDYAGLIDAFTRRVRSARPRPARALQWSVRVIDLRTELKTPEKRRYAVGSEGGNTTLELDGRKLLLPAGVRSTLDAMCARTTFRPVELPGDLDEHARLAFVRFLEDEGFLEQVEPG